MTHEIPPEGDEYNARRQEELHAAVANKATLTRRFYEMVRDGAPSDQIGAIVEVIASLDREIPHISKDLAVSVQGRNLGIFLTRLEGALEQSNDRMGVALKSNEATTERVLGKVALQLDLMTGLVQQVVNDHKTLKRDQKRQGKEIGALGSRLDTFETNIAADIQTRLARDDSRLTTLETNAVELHAMRKDLQETRDALLSLSARIGDALPTEADQNLSAQLRAERPDEHA